MSHGHNYANGLPSWVDLTTTDIEASKTFYTGLFGWTYTEGKSEFGGYINAMKDGQIVAGLNPNAQDDNSSWTLYFSVDDITKTCEVISENGGNVMFGPDEVGPLGSMAGVVTEATGFFGLWEGEAFKGAELFNKPGALTWEDLRSTDALAAQDFYNKIFGYRFDDLPMPTPENYKTFAFSDGKQPLGGMGGMMGQSGSSRWLVYLLCDDTPAAQSFVESNGGSIISPTTPTPFGRQCVVKDPFGAEFCVIDTEGAASQM